MHKAVLEIIKAKKAITEWKEGLGDPFKNEGLIRVFYGEPSTGLMDIVAVDNRKDLIMELARIEQHSCFKFITGTTGRLLVTYARETMAQEALKLNCEWMLFIDDDMIVPTGMFTELMKHADEADIIAPLCFQRVAPYKPVIYKAILEKTVDGGIFIKEIDNVLDYPINSKGYFDAVGFGVVLIKTEIFKKMQAPWFFSNTMLGEDIYFCMRAKDMGYKILVDTRIKVGHLALPRAITELDFLKANQEKLKEVRKDELDDLKEFEKKEGDLVDIEIVKNVGVNCVLE